MKQFKNQIVVAFVIAILSGSLVTTAQESKDEIQLVQTMWGMQKRDIINQYMKFTDEESAKFSPIYEAYSNEYKSLGAERINMMADYAANYATLTNEKADQLVQSLLKNNAAIDKLQLKYYNKIKKEISALRAAQFMQVELYIQTMVRAELQSNIPMIGELNSKFSQ